MAKLKATEILKTNFSKLANLPEGKLYELQEEQPTNGRRIAQMDLYCSILYGHSSTDI